MELQRWFQNEIFRPHQLPRKRRPKSTPGAAQVVLPSHTLTASERVAIYQNMYFARANECLAQDFPAVLRIIGYEAFRRLVRAYLTRHPSQHYSLTELGRHLPGFLEGGVRIPRRALVCDVARLELAMSRLIDVEESPVLTPADFARLPSKKWNRASLRPIRAFELLAFGHSSVNALVTAVRQDKPLPDVSRRRSWAVVYRKDYTVWRMDLTEPMFELFRALAAGKTVLQSIRAASRVWRGTPEELEESIFGWFAEAVNEGFFCAIEEARVPRRRKH